MRKVAVPKLALLHAKIDTAATNNTLAGNAHLHSNGAPDTDE